MRKHDNQLKTHCPTLICNENNWNKNIEICLASQTLDILYRHINYLWTDDEFCTVIGWDECLGPPEGCWNEQLTLCKLIQFYLSCTFTKMPT